jgi:DNA helicase II / ATP-dependent DNA helicase PcrA
VTVHSLVPVRRSARLQTTGDLVDALGVPFSDAQLAAITAPLEPGVIIAGAGSGKTTVMAARVVWLVGTGVVRPEEVLGLTFTRKAAAELSARVRHALLRAGVVADSGADESGEQLIMTYDAFAARLVAEHGLRLGFEADPTMLTGATRYRLAARVVKAAAGPFEFLSRLRPATVTERVLRLDADLQQHLVDPTELDKGTRDLLVALESAPKNNRGRTYADVARAMVVAQERLELASLVQEYQALKLRLGLVEFADQMAIAARLAVQAPPVSVALRSAFEVVLLDEYQDTSAAQAMMLRGLFSGSTPSEGLGHPVTAVGDPLQAIYGWRGAAASNILTFAETFRQRNGRPAADFALTVNRRSGRSILEVANQLSQSLRGDVAGRVGVGRLEPPAEAPIGQIRAATFESWAEEVTWIGEQVLAARSAGPAARWADIAVLTRRNADIAPLYAELCGREVPVEIVGLGGLLHLPEVMDVTATLRLVDDVTANPELVRLLTGPRWRIGPRDLALLGRRAQQLARDAGSTSRSAAGRSDGVLDALERAVADLDPTDVVSLLDALEDPGEEPYSAEARERFGRLAVELAYLRRHIDEPVPDLARRVIATLGLDIELLANPEFARASRRDQLGAFLDAVAAYVDVDGEASLTGLLAYLQAEVEQGAGLDQAVPSDREAVKLLTVHKAKGLEWEVVFLPALMQGTFPSDRVTDNWVTNPAVLPADLRGDASSIPQLADATNSAIGQYRSQLTEQQLLAEHRLAYVAVTRAKRLLIGSGHSWRPDLVRARNPSAYLRTIVEAARQHSQLLAEAAPPGAENPLVVDAAPHPWPQPLDPDALHRREEAAGLVNRARARFAASGTYEDPEAPPLLLDDEERLAGWDADLERLLAEARTARSGEQDVPLPAQLSTSAVMRLQADPQAFAAELARPMPQSPSRAARFGTRFHLWVERYLGPDRPRGALGQQPLVDPDDLPDRADAGAHGEQELRELCAAFAAGQFGHTVPYALEAPFSVALAGRLVRGRIDAVYAETGDGFAFQVVDWKTSRTETADPLQLAIYRLAWAEANQIPLAAVDAVFYYVRSDHLVRPTGLLGRPGLERLLAGNEGATTVVQ